MIDKYIINLYCPNSFCYQRSLIKLWLGKKLHYTSEIYIFLMMCLHVFILLLKSPSFLVEIRGGAISKGNGEGDSLKGLLQEFPFLYFSTFIRCGSNIQSKILPFHFSTFSCSLIYIYFVSPNSKFQPERVRIGGRLNDPQLPKNCEVFVSRHFWVHFCPCYWGSR